MITLETQGGLGNQLFQASIAIEIEILTGHRVELDTWRHGLEGGRPFELPSQLLGLEVRHSRHRVLRNSGAIGRASRGLRQLIHRDLVVEDLRRFDPRFLNPRDGQTLVGYFQSWRYSEHSIESVRNALDVIRNSSEWVAIHRRRLDEKGPWFALHIRRGDYVGTLGKGVFGTLDMRYYRRALKLINSAYPEARSVVFSDDFQGATRDYPQLLAESEVFNPTDSGSSLENMLLMGSGIGVITANSTFSWWAARLSRNMKNINTIPSNWFDSPGSTPDDLVPNEWNLL